MSRTSRRQKESIRTKLHDGPFQKFTFMGSEASHFGDWSTWTRYDDTLTKNELVKAMADFIGRDPWWDEAFPPQTPKWVDPISLSSGVEQMIDLRHYFSNNTKVFSTALAPAGMSLWPDGVLTGTPASAPLANYSFIGANDAGAVELSLSMEFT